MARQITQGQYAAVKHRGKWAAYFLEDGVQRRISLAIPDTSDHAAVVSHLAQFVRVKEQQRLDVGISIGELWSEFHSDR